MRLFTFICVVVAAECVLLSAAAAEGRAKAGDVPLLEEPVASPATTTPPTPEFAAVLNTMLGLSDSQDDVILWDPQQLLDLDEYVGHTPCGPRPDQPREYVLEWSFSFEHLSL